MCRAQGGRAYFGICLTPCKTTRYFINHIFFLAECYFRNPKISGKGGCLTDFPCEGKPLTQLLRLISAVRFVRCSTLQRSFPLAVFCTVIKFLGLSCGKLERRGPGFQAVPTRGIFTDHQIQSLVAASA